MNRVVAKIGLLWKRKEQYLPFALVGIAIAGATWTGFHPLLPGKAIGCLALAAGVMSLRPKMHVIEKALWIGVLITFTYQEIQTINRNDAANQSNADRQNKEFDRIVGDLKVSMKSSKDQYDDTIKHVNEAVDTTRGVAKTTQKVATSTKEVADLARKNLSNVTGGDSYAFIFPTDMNGQGLQYLNIENAGPDILTDINIEIGVANADFEEEKCNLTYSGSTFFIAPTLSPNITRRIAPEHSLTPVLNAEGKATYFIGINPQNVGVSEILEFRKAPSGSGLDYRLTVANVNPDDKRKDDVMHCGARMRFRKQTDWIPARGIP
jgi:hypothetical protein